MPKAIVSKVRAAISRAGLPGAELIRNAFGGYQFRLPRNGWVDVDAVVLAVHLAEAALKGGDLDGAAGHAFVARLITARPFLPGVEGIWADEWRRKLQELRIRAVSEYPRRAQRTPPGIMAGMPEKPEISADELARMLWQAEAKAGDVLMQQMLDMLGQQTFVGGKRVAIQRLPRLPKQAATTVHRVKVSLHGSRPPVWGRLEIPGAMRLDLVHEVMQVAFDWHGYHLHAFETVCGEFGAPDDDDDWSDRKDETTAALAQVAAAEKAKVVYAYDFGDDWRHDIVVEKITPAEPGVAYPRCTGGRRDAPPEDCGGIWAFNEYQAGLADTFDVGAVTARLAGLAEVLIPAS